MRSALAMMQTQQALSADDLNDLQAEAAIGMEQADRGHFVEFSAADVIAEGKQRLTGRQKAS